MGSSKYYDVDYTIGSFFMPRGLNSAFHLAVYQMAVMMRRNFFQKLLIEGCKNGIFL